MICELCKKSFKSAADSTLRKVDDATAVVKISGDDKLLIQIGKRSFYKVNF